MRGRKLMVFAPCVFTPIHKKRIPEWGDENLISIPIGLLLAMIKKESPNEGTKTPAQILHFRRIIKKESPNEGTKTLAPSLGQLR